MQAIQVGHELLREKNPQAKRTRVRVDNVEAAMGRVTLINIIGREDVEEKRESAPTWSGRSPEGIEWE